jgi:hypothetical protein
MLSLFARHAGKNLLALTLGEEDLWIKLLKMKLGRPEAVLD